MDIKIKDGSAIGVSIFEFAIGLFLLTVVTPIATTISCAPIQFMIATLGVGGGILFFYFGYKMLLQNGIYIEKTDNPLDVDLDKLYGEDTTRYDDD